MSDLCKKYLYKLSQSCDNASMALIRIRSAPDKAFEEDLDERLQAIDAYVKYMQESKRWLLYFKNKRPKPITIL